MVNKEKYTYEDFLEIIKTLRAPEGCPWDREQTHDSLRPCMLEEAYEFLSSVRILEETGSADNMCEELGDLLLQIVMHAEIADEEGLFTMEDVVNEISRKMVRRHPHVFGTTEVSGVSDVLTNWDDIKKKEKEGKTWIASPLKEIPAEEPEHMEVLLPSLRLDVCLAKVYNKSRGDILEYFRARKVYVNGRLCENNSRLLKEKDVVNLRGFGKFVFTGTYYETKKGKLRVEIDIFR